MSNRNVPLRNRLLSNSPDPIKSSILRESGMGWNPQPQGVQNTGSVSSTSSGDSLTSPLQIEKREPPGRRPVIPRRTSSSYKHMHNNNLVSKSPFKSQIPTPSPSSSKPKPIAISFPTSTSSPRRVSGEKRQRPSSIHDLAEHENSRPLQLKRERKQSKAFEVLYEKEPVSNSPFLAPSASSSASEDTKPQPLPIPKRRPASVPPPEEYLPPPRVPTPSRNTPSPGRSALVSRRMHGPRLSGSGRRERRKTVTFDERCDVVEFDRDEESGDDDVFESTSEEEDNLHDSMQFADEPHDNSISMQAIEDTESDSVEQDDDADPEESSFESTSSHDDTKKADLLMTLDPDASITGLVDNLFFSDDARSMADNSLASLVSTPPRQSSLPPELETEDGVPLGRSHHVERFLQHHSPHLGPQRISPSNSPTQSPGRYPFNLNLPTRASPNGPPATPPRRSPGMTHSTPPLGRTTHAERVMEAREQENDEVAMEVAHLPPSPSPATPQHAHEHTEDGLIPRYDLGQDLSASATDDQPDFHGASDPFARSLDEAIPAEVIEGSAEHNEPGSMSMDDPEFDRSMVDEPSRTNDSAFHDAEAGDDEHHEQDSDATTRDLARPHGSGSPAPRAGSPLVRGGSPIARLSSPVSTNGLQVNRPRINKDDVKRRLMGRRSLCSPSPEPRSPERSFENRASPIPTSESPHTHLAPLLHPTSPEQDRDKDRDRMSVLTTMTDMSTDTAIVGHAEKVAVAVGTLVSLAEAEEDAEFGMLGTEDRLKFDFGSKFSLGGMGMSHAEDDDAMDSTGVSTPHVQEVSSGYAPGTGMRMGGQDVDMDMKSALDRLMEDVAGGPVDDSMMTDDSFVSQDSEMTDASLPEAPLTRPKVHERAATDTVLYHSGVGFSSRVASDASLASPPPPVPPKDNIRAREQLILQKRRAARGITQDDSEDDGEDCDSPRPLPKKKQAPSSASRPGHHRRSMSVGDADGLAAHQRDEELLRLEALQTENLLGNIEKELGRLTEEPEKKKKYHVRERANTIYASSSTDKVRHMNGAGDLNAGRAWRAVRRPSDMNQYAQEIRAYRQEDKSKAYGKVFVKVLGIKGIHLPMPRETTAVSCTLNNGIHFVTTPDTVVTGENCALEQEFELIEHSKLEITLTIRVRKDPHIQAQLNALSAPPARTVAQTYIPTPPTLVQAHSKSHSRFSLFSSSPKKSKDKDKDRHSSQISIPVNHTPPAQPHRLPENLARYLKPDDCTLARAFIAFKDVIHRCDMRLFETSYPLIGQRAELGGKFSTQQVGEIVVQMFRLPPLPGVGQDDLPQSLEECTRGLRHINWHKVTYFQGTLTQSGGDCSTWRRRQFRVVGGNLVAFNDVTKRATAVIDLKKAIRLDDDQLSQDESMYGVERSFRLTFDDGDEIVFFADTDEEKSRWLEVLNALVGHIPPYPLWAELLWQRQEEMSNRAQAARQTARAMTYDPSASTTALTPTPQ